MRQVADLGISRARAFDVSLPFLLRQAAWLYERQLSQVKAQMRKVGKSGSSAVASPAPGAPPSTDQSGGYAMKRAGSGTTSTTSKTCRPRLVSSDVQCLGYRRRCQSARETVLSAKGKPASQTHLPIRSVRLMSFIFRIDRPLAETQLKLH